MGFKFLKNHTFGIDIDEHCIKVVQLRQQGKGFAVVAADQVEFQSFSDNPTQQQITAIRSCLKNSGIKAKQAIGCIKSDDAVIHNFEFPNLPEQELKQAVLLDAEQTCPFPLQQGVVDYHLFERQTGHQIQGIMVAALKESVEQRRSTIQKASVNCALIDIDRMALINCLEQTQTIEKDQVVAILNIGPSICNLIIVKKDTIPFLRDLPHGSDEIIESLAIEHEDKQETIRELLFHPEHLGDPNITLGRSLMSVCQPLITQIMDTIRYYYINQKVNTVDRMLVCGDFALAHNFIEMLDMQLPTTVELWNPFNDISYDESAEYSDLLKTAGPKMVVAAGLAMRSI